MVRILSSPKFCKTDLLEDFSWKKEMKNIKILIHVATNRRNMKAVQAPRWPPLLLVRPWRKHVFFSADLTLTFKINFTLRYDFILLVLFLLLLWYNKIHSTYKWYSEISIHGTPPVVHIVNKTQLRGVSYSGSSHISLPINITMQ